MAYFAKIVDNKVTNVIVAEKEWIEKDFVDDTPGRWIETFQDGTNGAYAGVGYVWDNELDAFYPPQLWPSWTLNKDIWMWQAPTSKPDDESVNKRYIWDENAYQADNTKGWVLIES
jgi:hypothetical protein